MFILETLNFVVDILKVPSVLVGLIALIGLVAQKKAFSDVVKGTIKTILGFIVLGGGATVLVGSLNPLGGMFEHAFTIQGIIPNNEAIVSIALEKYGAATALIMAFGMVANIIVARFTRLKYIFLTGHHTFYMACMIGVILTVAGFEGVGLVFTGSLILGLVMAFFPALAQRAGISAAYLNLIEHNRRPVGDALLARLDGMAARADKQVFGSEGNKDALVPEVRATVAQLNGLLADTRTSLKKVDAVLVEAQAIGANAREATTDLGALRAEVESNLRKVESLVNEINRKWPFARDTELKLP